MASADLLEDSRAFNLLLVNDGMCRHESHINTCIGTYTSELAMMFVTPYLGKVNAVYGRSRCVGDSKNGITRI